MSEEKDLPEATEPDGSKTELKFSQEHYDRLMKGQWPWAQFCIQRLGEEGDPWEAFEKDRTQDAAVILDAIMDWNAESPKPSQKYINS